MGPVAFWESNMEAERPYTRPGEAPTQGKPMLVETVYSVKDATGRRVSWRPTNEKENEENERYRALGQHGRLHRVPSLILWFLF